MNLGKLGQVITGKEIFDLIHDDLERVEKEISLETVALVDVVTQIGQYLQESGGKLWMAGAQGYVRDCFRVTRLDTIFQFCGTVEDALAANQRG